MISSANAQNTSVQIGIYNSSMLNNKDTSSIVINENDKSNKIENTKTNESSSIDKYKTATNVEVSNTENQYLKTSVTGSNQYQDLTSRLENLSIDKNKLEQIKDLQNQMKNISNDNIKNSLEEEISKSIKSLSTISDEDKKDLQNNVDKYIGKTNNEISSQKNDLKEFFTNIKNERNQKQEFNLNDIFNQNKINDNSISNMISMLKDKNNSSNNSMTFIQANLQQNNITKLLS